MTNRRGSALRRQINEFGMHGGEVQESKIWAQIGKLLCIWLIYKYAEALINHWEVLLVLISWLIAPEIAKKAITMRFGGSGLRTEVTESRSSSSTTTTAKAPKVETTE